nr:MAG TPA: Head Tail Connector Protein [Caudoviricetes sp.]
MGYVSYVTPEYYKEIYKGSTVQEADLERYLRQASRHIDSLTYNRIVGRGFSSLTEFQQEVIQEVICQQADFEYENADEINTILSSYSINGVSAQFGSSWNVFMDKGVAMKRDVYAQLSQTGLCCRLAR